jgi:hypothetical protein
MGAPQVTQHEKIQAVGEMNAEELYQCTACDWIGPYGEFIHLRFGECDGVDKCPNCEFVETMRLYGGPPLHLCEKCGDHYAEAGDDHCKGCNAADYDTLREQWAERQPLSKVFAEAVAPAKAKP